MSFIHEDVQAHLIANTTFTNAAPSFNRIYVDTWLPTGYKYDVSGAALVMTPQGGTPLTGRAVDLSTIRFRAFSGTVEDSMSIIELLNIELFEQTHADSSEQWYPQLVESVRLFREAGGLFVTEELWDISKVRC